MQLNPAAFNRFLRNIGQQATWRRAYSCACLNPASNAPDARCLHCRGKGTIWPGEPVPTVVGMSSQKTQAKWAAMGRYSDGDVVLTVPGDSPMWDIGQFDRVVMLNATERFSQGLVRGSPAERLNGRILEIERVFWISKQSGNIIDAVLPTISGTGAITFPDGMVPPAGQSYSITGERRPEYYCYENMPSNRNEHSGARLPKNVVLRKFDLWGRGAAAA
jgi:hypothetical protein